ncbi:Tubby-like F-box protein 11 [Raphanus sativus]|uniref:Tubby-like F-box protein 11 n=1 Tax=Raphanus sativus TaxID=3726 RepID=A0A6J0KDD6_RAPSA|nr:tubby-like F-box protein 11 [Raphanus sativus]KAJ4882521.1 Tubby-like F-box protein 11 [Raphanus sativus]
MTLRSLILEMRSRSHRVVHDLASAADSAPASSEANRWSDIPEELLREILIRVEAADGGGWPSRRSVVACAGVCRGWRVIMNETVAVPEISSKLTFPISLKQPGPRESLVQCFIKRNRATQSYHLYLGLTNSLTDEGKFLLAATKLKHTTCTDYIISLRSDDMSRRSQAYVGKVRSNFLGTKFTVFDGNMLQSSATTGPARLRKNRSYNPTKASAKVPLGSYPVSHITYELNVLGSRGPRKMQCVMDTIPTCAMEQPRGVSSEFPFLGSTTTRSAFSRSQSKPLRSGGSSHVKETPLVLSNKTPRWHEQLRCWCLNFHGRVTVASVKNFQLVAAEAASSGAGEGMSPERQNQRIILQFGKVGKDVFTMDYGYPISAFQAFAICLSSFETRIACE